MSKLSLDSFVAYKRSGSSNVFEFYPAQRSVVIKDKRQVVTLGDIPLPTGVTPPKNAVTLLYGFRDSLDELANQHRIASGMGMSVIKVSCKLEIGAMIMGSTNFERLPETRFLNTRRLQQDLGRVILDGVNERMISSAKGKVAVIYDNLLEAGQRADLICDVVRAEKMFSNIIAIAYSVPDGTKNGRQVCSVFSSDFEDISFRGDMPFDIEFPSIQP